MKVGLIKISTERERYGVIKDNSLLTDGEYYLLAGNMNSLIERIKESIHRLEFHTPERKWSYTETGMVFQDFSEILNARKKYPEYFI